MSEPAPATTPTGVLVREWRLRRRLSQLDLAAQTGISTRHLSFIETGRSQPTREMLMRLSEQLDVPLRDRNALLLAGGFAPEYPQHRLSDLPMAAVSEAIEQILRGHLPYPAVVVDRHWNMIDANDAVRTFLDGVAEHLLEPPVNVLRLSLHPEGMAPRIRNLGQWRNHVLERLWHQVATTGDEQLAALHAELRGYPAPPECSTPVAHALVVPLELATDTGETLSFLSTTTVFGTPLDVTVAELAIESFYPADDVTRVSITSRINSMRTSVG
ncbi:helix-turn-helix domain-containing protein [Aldersonia kunmingensis]|uniref:helix-turn-helix domain-containing protein n=1 Tax=Aldersonia kunmingensis TaxID=408066 RepID=UPI00082D1843|nr:helix-turn-helix transcriptional regulator [Aldersonia kunmingensis]